MPDRTPDVRALSPEASRWRTLLIVGLALLAAVGIYLYHPRPWRQDFIYHQFADQHPYLGIPHCCNVISNVPYSIVGILGLWFLFTLVATRPGGPVQGRAEWWSFLLLFFGVGLTGWGSTYYHLDPGNERLVWDRLPMAIAFMALFAETIAERISPRAGGFLLLPLVALGIASVWYWYLRDDLRPYGLVQFYPLLAIPLMLWLFPPRYTRTGDWWIALAWYGLAKVCETWDAPIYSLTGFISGHTIKHLVSALGAYWILRMLHKRQPVHSL